MVFINSQRGATGQGHGLTVPLEFEGCRCQPSAAAMGRMSEVPQGTEFAAHSGAGCYNGNEDDRHPETMPLAGKSYYL